MQLRSTRLDRCPTCGSERIAHRLSPPRQDVEFQAFSLYACADCDTCFVNPRPVHEDIPKLYDSREYGMDMGTRSSVSYWLKATKLRLYCRRVFRHSSGRGLSVLDYGCGDGMLATALARHGRDGRVARVVASDFALARPPGLGGEELAPVEVTYTRTSPALWQEHARSFDLVVMRHVLEHTPSPAATLARMTQLLKPGGVLVVEIPNAGSPWMRVFGSHYCQLGIPQHLVLYNERAFRRMLADLERDHALSLVELEGVNVPVLGSSLGHVLTGRFDNIGPAAAALYPAQLVVDVVSRRRTAMMAYLRVP